MELNLTELRPLGPSSSLADPNTKRFKPSNVTDAENPADRMDVDTSLRTLATSHPLDPDAEENVSKKARVARNVLHIRGEDELKFDVNEEDWPNAELAIRSSCEGTLIVGRSADKVKARDEREITQMTDLQLCSWITEEDAPPRKSMLLTRWARRMKGNEVRSRCVLKDFATIVRDDVFAPTPSPVPVTGLLLYAAWSDLCVQTANFVCAFMQADTSCEMFA